MASKGTATISIIVPIRNEGQGVVALLVSLRALMQEGDELIVVDGGSDDDGPRLAAAHADQLIHCAPGRARQMNAGAEHARGDWLWFLHADSVLPAEALSKIRGLPEQARWGRFDLRLSAPGLLFRLIALLINLRSRLTAIATGDQGLFVRRDCFTALGGYPDQPLMEDIELCRQLRRIQRPYCLRPPLQTSARRWQQHGTWRTIWLMWSLRLRYWRGASAAQLHREYYRD